MHTPNCLNYNYRWKVVLRLLQKMCFGESKTEIKCMENNRTISIALIAKQFKKASFDEIIVLIIQYT